MNPEQFKLQFSEKLVRYRHSKGVTEDVGSGIGILSNTLCASGSIQFLRGIATVEDLLNQVIGFNEDFNDDEKNVSNNNIGRIEENNNNRPVNLLK
ncbi:hypothetical protein LXL04_005396 [Taraxacum kok-saghyz]